MNCFTVSLFGHRDIDDLFRLERKLTPIIKELLNTKEYVSFLIGRNGEFDEFSASLVKRIRKENGSENSELNLVLPYNVSELEFYENYYDNIIIPESINSAHYKAAISLRNRWMVEQSDLIICYVERENGGAFSALKYAKKHGKQIINLTEIQIN